LPAKGSRSQLFGCLRRARCLRKCRWPSYPSDAAPTRTAGPPASAGGFQWCHEQPAQHLGSQERKRLDTQHAGRRTNSHCRSTGFRRRLPMVPRIASTTPRKPGAEATGHAARQTLHRLALPVHRLPPEASDGATNSQHNTEEARSGSDWTGTTPDVAGSSNRCPICDSVDHWSRTVDQHLSADCPHERFLDFAVSWHSDAATVGVVPVNRVVATFPNEMAAMCFQMPNQVAAFHPVGRST
jgi:hypothetical protein